jgi:hypothetical protein
MGLDMFQAFLQQHPANAPPPVTRMDGYVGYQTPAWNI